MAPQPPHRERRGGASRTVRRRPQVWRVRARVGHCQRRIGPPPSSCAAPMPARSGVAPTTFGRRFCDARPPLGSMLGRSVPRGALRGEPPTTRPPAHPLLSGFWVAGGVAKRGSRVGGEGRCWMRPEVPRGPMKSQRMLSSPDQAGTAWLRCSALAPGASMSLLRAPSARVDGRSADAAPAVVFRLVLAEGRAGSVLRHVVPAFEACACSRRC